MLLGSTSALASSTAGGATPDDSTNQTSQEIQDQLMSLPTQTSTQTAANDIQVTETAASGASTTITAPAASGPATNNAAAPSDYNQPCGPALRFGRNAIFGVQTTPTPAVTWGWFVNPAIADLIFVENPFFRVNWNNNTTVNGRKETGPGPKNTGTYYTYHSSIKRLNNGRVLKFGDKVHIENFLAGSDSRIKHLDFYCTVEH